MLIKNAKFIVPALSVLGLALIVLISYFFFFTPNMNNILDEAAEEVNKICPQMIDEETRIDNAEVLGGNTFRYNYTMLKINADSIEPLAFKAYMEPIIVNEVKTSKNLILFREMETTLVYSYKDKNGKFIMEVRVGPEQYSRISDGV